MKTSMTSLDVTAVVAELNRLVLGWRINNVYEPEHGTLLLKLRSPEGLFRWLLIEEGRRTHLTSYHVGTAGQPRQFCQGLRKRISNAVIDAIIQYDLDRILEFHAHSGPALFHLVVEVMDRGNTLLLDSNRIVLLASKYGRLSGRAIRRGETYNYPKSRGFDPLTVTVDELTAALAQTRGDVVRALVKTLNMAGEVAEEACLRARIDRTTPASQLTPADVAGVLAQLREMTDAVRSLQLTPHIYAAGEDLLSACPLEFLKYSDSDATYVESFNEACDNYFGWLKRVQRSREKEEEVEKWRAIAAKQMEYAQQLTEEASRLRAQGTVVLKNLHVLEPLLKSLKELRRQGLSTEEIQTTIMEAHKSRKEPLNIVEHFDMAKSEASLKIGDIGFVLDLRCSAPENGSRLFSSAKELEGKARNALLASEETEEKIRRAEAAQSATFREPERRRMRTRWYERFRWAVSTDGFLIIGGRDASQNEALVRRYLDEGDVFVHADLHGAPVVVVKCEGKPVSTEAITQAARFAVAYSSGWKGGLADSDAFWVTRSQVSLTPPAGEYLPKGAFMIRGKKHYVRSIPLVLSIGITGDDSPKLMAGPSEAVAAKSDIYVTVKPGRHAREQAAAMIQNKMRSLSAGKGRAVADVPAEQEILDVLPDGGMEIVE